MKLSTIKANEPGYTCPMFADYLNFQDRHDYEGHLRDALVRWQYDPRMPHVSEYHELEAYLDATVPGYGWEASEMINAIRFFWTKWVQHLRKRDPEIGYSIKTAKHSLHTDYDALLAKSFEDGTHREFMKAREDRALGFVVTV